MLGHSGWATRRPDTVGAALGRADCSSFLLHSVRKPKLCNDLRAQMFGYPRALQFVVQPKWLAWMGWQALKPL